MKKKKWLFTIIIIVVIAIFWCVGIIPKQIAKIAGTNYVEDHFPEMQLECTGVEWADVYGDYLITFKDNTGNTYSCVIGPAFFPVFLGQGLFAIEDYYSENYEKFNGRDSRPNPAYTYIVMESKSSLLVAEIGEDGKAIETKQYSVPNWFTPSTEIKAGYKIEIEHNDVILETFPMKFGEIYRMNLYDEQLNPVASVIVD